MSDKTEEKNIESVDLEEIVKESKENLAASSGESPPTKRRGRPKKISKENQSTEQTQSSISPVQPNTSLKPMLETIVMLPASVLSASTGYNGFSLNQPEKDMLSSQADVLAQTYMPSVSGDPNTPLYLFLASYGFVMFGKYLEYLKWKKVREDEKKKREAELSQPITANQE